MIEFARDPEFLAEASLALVVYAPTEEARILCGNALAAGWFALAHAELKGRATLDAAWSLLDESAQPLRREDLSLFAAMASGEAARNMALGTFAVGQTAPVWVRACAVLQPAAGGEIERVVRILTAVTAEVNSSKAASPISRLTEVGFESAGAALFIWKRTQRLAA
jgi:hypothetical protein